MRPQQWRSLAAAAEASSVRGRDEESTAFKAEAQEIVRSIAQDMENQEFRERFLESALRAIAEPAGMVF
jgi:hypothetical protein